MWIPFAAAGLGLRCQPGPLAALANLTPIRSCSSIGLRIPLGLPCELLLNALAVPIGRCAVLPPSRPPPEPRAAHRTSRSLC